MANTTVIEPVTGGIEGVPCGVTETIIEQVPVSEGFGGLR